MSSDYFGALLRSAGHVPRTARSASAREKSAAGFAPGRTASENRSAPDEGESPSFESMRDVASTDFAGRAPTSGEEAAAFQTNTAQPAYPPSRISDSPPTATSNDSIDSASAREGTERSPPAIHAALKAALSWADANSYDTPTQSVPARSQQTTLGLRETADTLAASHEHDAEREVGSAEFLSAGEARPAQQDEPRDPFARPARAGAAADAHRSSEVVEVTIGEIHLRVDAPAQSKVTQRPAVTPPREAAPQSSLSRRALYRI
jgi:hypothetical protein